MSLPRRSLRYADNFFAVICSGVIWAASLSVASQRPRTLFFCENPVCIHESGSFKLSLSENATFSGGIVDVTCVQLSQAADKLVLRLKPRSVPIGKRDITVWYNVTELGNSQPGEVQCSAQSRKPAAQFVRATAKDIAKFTYSPAGSIEVFPKFVYSRGPAVKIHVLLDRQFGDHMPEVTVSCIVQVVKSPVEAVRLRAQPKCLLPVVVDYDSPAINPLLNGWYITPSCKLTFKKGKPWHQQVAIEPYDIKPDDIDTILVTTCCTPAEMNNNNSRYMNLMDSVVTVVRTSKTVKPRFTVFKEQVVQKAGLQIKPPGSEEVAPCPCDLTYRHCDYSCCCDEDCTSLDHLAFEHCIPGPFGGGAGDLPDFMCNSAFYNNTDYMRFMCVEKQKEINLGNYFSNMTYISQLNELKEVIAELQGNRYFDFKRRNEMTAFETTITNYGYKDGMPVQTLYYTKDKRPIKGHLTLPLMLNGHCMPESPVRYLRGRTTLCVSSILTWSTNTMLSAHGFMQPLNIVGAKVACRQLPRVLKSIGYHDFAAMDVKYYCFTKRADVARHYLFSDKTSSDIHEPKDLRAFPTSALTAYAYDVPLPARCSWDNGYTPAPVPEIDSQFQVNNIVLEVRYRIKWSGTSIHSMEVVIVLGQVSFINALAKGIGQRFSVVFDHVIDITNIQKWNVENPGYVIGQLVPSAIVSGSDRVSGSNKLKIMRPDNSGLCDQITYQPLQFGYQQLSGCAIRLSQESLGDCAMIRNLVVDFLKKLVVPELVLARHPSAKTAESKDWAKIHFESHVYGYSLFNYKGDRLILTEFQKLQIGAVCSGVPTHVSVNIMYSYRGHYSQQPVYIITGGVVRYRFSNWNMTCGAENAARCVKSDGNVQNFFVHMSINFIQTTDGEILKRNNSKRKGGSRFLDPLRLTKQQIVAGPPYIATHALFTAVIVIFVAVFFTIMRFSPTFPFQLY